MKAVVRYVKKDEKVSVHLANIKRAEFSEGQGIVEDVNGAKLVVDISGDVVLEFMPDEDKED